MIQISDKNCYLNITNFTVPGYFLFSTKCSRKFLHLQLSARFTGAILELTERFMAFQRHQTAMISAFVAPSRGQLAINNNVTRHQKLIFLQQRIGFVQLVQRASPTSNENCGKT